VTSAIGTARKTSPALSSYLLRPLLGLTALSALLLSSCEGGGHFTVFGYTTKPNYDLSIHTVYVPIFKNLTLRRGLEFDLTRAVVREIEAKTPYKVVSDPDAADTELIGTIISFNKNILNRNQLNEVREAETTLAAEVVWRDRRSGEILSRPRRGPGAPPTLPADAPPGTKPPPPPPVLVQSVGGFIPELGGSITTAEKQNVDRWAVQIVSMMEVPW
jgi:hypothetical protein